MQNVPQTVIDEISQLHDFSLDIFERESPEEGFDRDFLLIGHEPGLDYKIGFSVKQNAGLPLVEVAAILFTKDPANPCPGGCEIFHAPTGCKQQGVRLAGAIQSAIRLMFILEPMAESVPAFSDAHVSMFALAYKLVREDLGLPAAVPQSASATSPSLLLSAASTRSH